ncbi:MAG: protein translocase subunit SecD [Ilumatobacteraceae bacterium]
MQRKLVLPLAVTLIVSLGGLLAILISGDHPSLGLDLQGGISVTQQPVGDYDPAVLDLAVERIRERIDSLGVAEPEIIRQGDAIVVNLPGVKNQQEAVDLVQVTGQVYLRGVQGCIADNPDTSSTTTTDPNATSTTAADTGSTVAPTTPVTSAAPGTTAAPGPSRPVSATPTTDGGTGTTAPSTTASATSAPSDQTTMPGSTVPGSTVPGETTVPTDTTAPPTGSDTVQSDPTQQQLLPLASGGQCLVSPAGATGTVFKNDAAADIIQGGWGVRVGLRDGADGVDLWNQLATQCYNRDQTTCPSGQLAIELDGEIISAPTVQEPRFSGDVSITGQFSEREAKNLARVLKSGSLPVRMETQSVQNVSPTLGRDSLDAAIISGAIGVALVLVMLTLYYGTLLGFTVFSGVAVGGALLYSVISLLSKTQGLALSLAGVAGVIVSVGVTVDSYVVFFERLKDEIRGGRTMRNSAQRGFAAAWHTILVADVVSLIGALTLWYLTVGSVRNFAFFLGLSTFIDLLIAYYFTRPMVLLLARTDWMARRKVMGIEAVQAPSSGRPSAGATS